MNVLKSLMLALPLIGLTACAEHMQMVKARDAQDLAEFKRYAGEPIKRINGFTPIDRWRSFDDQNFAIWIGTNRAYLVTLRRPCFDLHHQLQIRITGRTGTIDPALDRVEFDQQRCRIHEIRPFDDKARRAARLAAQAT